MLGGEFTASKRVVTQKMARSNVQRFPKGTKGNQEVIRYVTTISGNEKDKQGRRGHLGEVVRSRRFQSLERVGKGTGLASEGRSQKASSPPKPGKRNII